MATNPATDYGLDIQCINDADELFSEVEGIQVVAQDALHLLLSDDFLGPDGDGLGYDCRRLIGLPDSALIVLQPTLEAVLKQDDRILTATVLLTPTRNNGVSDVTIKAICETAEGPFTLTKNVSDLTEADLNGDTQGDAGL